MLLLNAGCYLEAAPPPPPLIVCVTDDSKGVRYQSLTDDSGYGLDEAAMYYYFLANP